MKIFFDPMAKVATIDDMVTEIAVHIPPSDPARLFRVSFVCKSWGRVVTSSEFREAYARRHGRPPFLGYFLSSPNPDDAVINRFVPSAPTIPVFSPHIGTDTWYALDVRQGRVLLLTPGVPDLMVWLPMSGEHFPLPDAPRSFQYQAGAVVCANSPHCNDPSCFSLHNFCVIFVGCEDELVTFNDTTFFEGNKTWACTYRLETDKWGEICLLEDDRYTEHPLLEQQPPVLIGDGLYFTLETHKLEGEEVLAALRFDLAEENLSVVLAPEDADPDFGMFLPTSEGLAFAGTGIADDDEVEGEGNAHDNHLCIWTLGADNWNTTCVIDLEVTLPPGAIQPAYPPSPIGFFEGESTICIESGERVFAIEVASLITRDIGPSDRSLPILPFRHFCMPSLPKLKDNKESGAGGAASKETDGGAFEFTEDEGKKGLEDKRSCTGQAEDVGKKRWIQVETPSGKKAKGEQSTEGEESSSGEDSWW